MTPEQLETLAGFMMFPMALLAMLYLVLSFALDDRMEQLAKSGKMPAPPPRLNTFRAMGGLRGLANLFSLGPANCPDPGAIRLARWLRVLWLLFFVGFFAMVWVWAGAPSIPPPDRPNDVRVGGT
jgi:hypothetical protein